MTYYKISKLLNIFSNNFLEFSESYDMKSTLLILKCDFFLMTIILNSEIDRMSEIFHFNIVSLIKKIQIGFWLLFLEIFEDTDLAKKLIEKRGSYSHK